MDTIKLVVGLDECYDYFPDTLRGDGCSDGDPIVDCPAELFAEYQAAMARAADLRAQIVALVHDDCPRTSYVWNEKDDTVSVQPS